MSGVKYSDLSKVIRYGKYVEEFTESGDIETKVVRSIDIDMFYRMYIKLNNVIGVRRMGAEIIDTKLTGTHVDLLVHLMKKPSDFSILFRNKDASLIKLGEELGKTASSIYSSVSKLRKAGYLVRDEDNLFVLSKEMRDLVKITRHYLNNGEPLKFDFLFKFCVEDK